MSKKTSNFIKGAAILSAAGLIVKILGAIFRIPLTRIIGTEGMGLYGLAYPIYNFLLVISSAGFPVAISKLVAEAVSNFFAPCYSYYKYLNEVLSGRSHLREGIVREISKKPIYKDNKNYYYEVLVEMDDDLYAQFLYDSNLGKPPLEVGKPVQMKCYENFIIEILEQAK